MFKKIIILCVGNICRSPVGEAFFKKGLENIDKNIKVSSAGLAALVGHPAHPIMQELMTQKGMDISDHQARQVSLKILLDSDLILVMETKHQIELEAMAPNIRGRVQRLGKWSGFDIPDPFNRPRLFFEQSMALIEQAVTDWQNKLWN